MSVAGIASTALFSVLNGIQGSSQNTNAASGSQQFETVFQQLGEDLQSGNLTQAQQDYATLSQDFPGVTSNGSTSLSSSTSSNPIAQAFSALSQALQNGNLSAAQQDFSTVQQDLQQQSSSGRVHGHRHHHGGGGGQQQQVDQAFASLSQALQSGNLSGAQSAFASLQQDLESFDSTASTTSLDGTGGTSSALSQSGSNLSIVA